MRMTMFALSMFPLSLFPLAASAQSVTDPIATPPVQQSQSCAAGQSWDGVTQSCIASTPVAAPMQGMSGHGCSGSSAKAVSS